MKILLIHNRYEHKGGEDVVFESERRLLESMGHSIASIEFNNNNYKNIIAKAIWGLFSIFNPFSFLYVIYKIYKQNPDVIHVHNLFFSASPSVIWSAWLCNKPLIMTLHNFRIICPSATLQHNGTIYEKSLRSFFPWDAVKNKIYHNSRIQTTILASTITIHRIIGTWKKVQFFFVLSEFCKNKFLSSNIGLPREKYVLKPNFTQKHEANSCTKDDYIFIGRLSPEKGVKILIDAISGTDHKLTIVGDGPLRDFVKASCKENNNITYAGAIPQKEVVKLIAKSRALIFPSTWYETFGMVAIEAFSSGTPVIASNLGTMKEIISDEINGLLFEAGNVRDLRKKLDRLAGDQILYEKLRTQAFSTWEKKYTEEINSKLLIDTYNRAIKNIKPNSPP